MLARLTRDLPGFLRRPTTVSDAGTRLRHELAAREQRLLELCDQHIFSDPDNPFALLLKAAGCERGDVAVLVREEGVEGALRHLAAPGV